MSNKMSNYRVVCLAAENGDRYLILRNLDTGESNIYKNKLVNDIEGAFSGDNVIDTNVVPISAEDFGLADPAVAKYIELEDIDEREIEMSPSVDHSYSGALIDEKFLASMDIGFADLGRADQSLILKAYRMLDGIRVEERYINPRIVRRPFAYDVQSNDPNLVLRGAIVRFIIPYRGKIDPDVAYVFPSLSDSPVPPKKPKPVSIPKTPEGKRPARETVRMGKADRAPGDVIAKPRSGDGLTGTARWQRFWSEMEEIEKRKGQ